MKTPVLVRAIDAEPDLDLVFGRSDRLSPWDAAAAGHARLEDEATTAVALLERFGDLLAVALDAAGRADDGGLDRAVAERAWVVAELRPLLASLAEARAARPRSAADAEARARLLAPVDEALRHAGLLHARITDEMERWAPVAIVR